MSEELCESLDCRAHGALNRERAEQARLLEQARRWAVAFEQETDEYVLVAPGAEER